MTAATLCELHNLPTYSDGKPHPGACLVCHTVTGECDFGGCTRPAVVTVVCESRGYLGCGPLQVLDRRPACAGHAAEIGDSYRRAGHRPVWETSSGARDYTGSPWRLWSTLHSDHKGTYRGRRMVLTNQDGGTCLVPWEGPAPTRTRKG